MGSERRIADTVVGAKVDLVGQEAIVEERLDAPYGRFVHSPVQDHVDVRFGPIGARGARAEEIDALDAIRIGSQDRADDVDMPLA